MFNQWESIAPMPVATLHPAVAATNQRIYMFGGEDCMQYPVRLIQVRHKDLHLVCRFSMDCFIHSFSRSVILCSYALLGLSHRQEHVV